jgi:glyoxylase-like metal-dependent hydrolase (beta-lactamase superfamily II)
VLKLPDMLITTEYGEITRFDLARTLAGRGRYWTTCYLVNRTMIDTGCAFTAEELKHALRGIEIERIVNTHTHEDHIGANGILQDQYQQLEILAHPSALPVLNDPRSTQPLHPYRRLFWGWPKPSKANKLEDDQIIAMDEYLFQVIYTPGHSPDHICLYEQNRGWLFSGDLFAGGQDRALRAGYDIWKIIDSLKRVIGLPLTTLFPGCARVRENPQQELMSKIVYLEDLGNRVLELIKKGWSPSRIARHTLGKTMWVEIVTLGHFSRFNLVRSFLCQNEDSRR